MPICLYHFNSCIESCKPRSSKESLDDMLVCSSSLWLSFNIEFCWFLSHSRCLSKSKRSGEESNSRLQEERKDVPGEKKALGKTALRSCCTASQVSVLLGGRRKEGSKMSKKSQKQHKIKVCKRGLQILACSICLYKTNTIIHVQRSDKMKNFTHRCLPWLKKGSE